MSPEELKSKERAVAREYPETKAAFAVVRQAMVDALVASGSPEAEKRERLYHSIRAIDQVEAVMLSILSAGSADIEQYVKQLTDSATTGQ